VLVRLIFYSNKETIILVLISSTFLRTNYKRCFGSFFHVHVTYMQLEKAAETTFVQKTWAYKVAEIDTLRVQLIFLTPIWENIAIFKVTRSVKKTKISFNCKFKKKLTILSNTVLGGWGLKHSHLFANY